MGWRTSSSKTPLGPSWSPWPSRPPPESHRDVQTLPRCFPDERKCIQRPPTQMLSHESFSMNSLPWIFSPMISLPWFNSNDSSHDFSPMTPLSSVSLCPYLWFTHVSFNAYFARFRNFNYVLCICLIFCVYNYGTYVDTMYVSIPALYIPARCVELDALVMEWSCVQTNKMSGCNNNIH